ncbi:MAG: hypothetical protein HOH33_10165 [Verrucomicrobia bacterium]|jgi:hypothetical protein|nr:hypothetical protein [Verrucomicrobiota bacterium]
MKSDGFPKHLLIAFGMALLGYILLYSCDRHLRSRKGAWEFTFSSSSSGEPTLTIDQPHYGISKVRIVFEGEAFEGPTRRIRFDKPGIEVPFGKSIFFDTTFLPGSVTFDLFGHEVEVLPRTLIINFKEYPWKVGEVIRLKPEDAWSRQVEAGEQVQP